MMQKLEIAQESAQIAGIVLAESFAIADGQLEGRAFQMRQQDFQVVGVDVSALRRAIEEVLGMLNDVLIERRAGSYQHSQ
jgi:hypothetical protein